MKSFEYTITDPVGIHARPAGILVKEIKKYASTVTVIKGEKSVNALKLMALMGMGITLPVDQQNTLGWLRSRNTIALMSSCHHLSMSVE